MTSYINLPRRNRFTVLHFVNFYTYHGKVISQCSNYMSCRILVNVRLHKKVRIEPKMTMTKLENFYFSFLNSCFRLF